MSAKLTIEEMQKIAKERGGKCLSGKYVNKRTKLTWKCKEEHVWEATPDSIKRGRWCPHCAGNITSNIEEMRNIAEGRGGKCLSKNYVNSSTKLTWQCKEGHIWDAVPRNVIHNNAWCPYCRKGKVGNNIKGIIEDFQEIAKSRGGKCLSMGYTDNKTKLKWQCKEGHMWEAAPDAIKRGTWCPYCAGNIRLTIEAMRQLAKSRGGKCLSKEYISSVTKLTWQCENGHTWSATPGSIKMGGWCPYCAGKAKLTIEEMQKLAESKGGKCLSKNYVDSSTKLTWKCKEEHVWEATPSDVKQGSWCPCCSVGLSERICRKYFEVIFQEKFPKKHPKWLINESGNGLELDGYCENLQLAFEYQGEQHYLSRFYRGNPKFQQIQKHDQLKIKLCKQHNVKLITIPYTVKHEEIQEYIISECRKKHVKMPKDVQFIDFKSLNVFSPELLKEMQQIAKSRGGKCLSKKYIDSTTKLKWQCKEGHVWEVTSAHIKYGSWCPYCAGSVKSTIEKMQKLAENKGGKCLSKEYKGNKIKLKWQCKEGHVWEAKPNSVVYGYWCPHCAGVAKLTIEEMQELARSNGGKCLSKEYKGNKIKLKWQCKEGHTWSAKPNAIKTGTWCPYCVGNVKCTIEDMQKLVEHRGGRCLSTTYMDNKTKLEWECKEGHIFWMRPNDVQQGQWCPVCARLKRK